MFCIRVQMYSSWKRDPHYKGEKSVYSFFHFRILHSMDINLEMKLTNIDSKPPPQMSYIKNYLPYNVVLEMDQCVFLTIYYHAYINTPNCLTS